jgi:hypothetical protein
MSEERKTVHYFDTPELRAVVARRLEERTEDA